MFGEDHLAKPLNKSLPDTFPHQNNGEPPDFLSLNQRERFKQFVESSKSPRHHDEALGIADKHDFSDKEIVEGNQFVPVDIVVMLLFEWQVEIEPHRFASRSFGSLVARFHDAGTASGDYAVAVLHEREGD